MFVYSMKASTIRFFAVICIAMTALLVLIAFAPSYDVIGGEFPTLSNGGSVNYSKIKTNEDRIKFLEQFGWTAEEQPIETEEVTLPGEFDKIYNQYNEIQKKQGLDLSKYKGKELTRYTYKVTNYSNYEGVVYANILVYRNKVVGGDICSADINGFVHGFEKSR